jgi:hypothetical protein
MATVLIWKELVNLKLMLIKIDQTRNLKFLFNFNFSFIALFNDINKKFFLIFFRYSNSKKILEINPNHPAIKELLKRVKDDPDKETEELA